MKQIYTLILMTLTLSFVSVIHAQKTYTISSNTSWTAGSYPSYCSSCTFNISSGKTLTLNSSSPTCANCVFTGGNIAITQAFICQTCSFSSDSITMSSETMTLESSTSTFSKTVFNVAGNGAVIGDAAVTLTNSLFIFNGTSYFLNNGGALNMTGSIMDFYGSSYFLANAGPVNLISTSSLVAGNGNKSNTSYIEMNGPQLNIYDNSFIGLANLNNYYFNWTSYYSESNNKTYSTSVNTMNCGRTGQNACATPKVYGPASLNSMGILSNNVLPVVLSEFSATLNGNEVLLQWQTQQEINSDYFTVERSEDGINWSPIATVKAMGTTTEVTNYSFTDEDPLHPASYYRLQMTDEDGSALNSGVVNIQFQNTENNISVYPNPIQQSSFTVKTGSEEVARIQLYGSDGRLFNSYAVQGQTQYQLQLPASIPHNSYLIIKISLTSTVKTLVVLNK
jgi:hypothetical protein